MVFPSFSATGTARAAIDKNHGSIEEAMMKIHHAFDPQQSDLVHRLLIEEKSPTTPTKLAYFIQDKDDVSAIEHDLDHFRRYLLAGDISTALPLLKRSVDKLDVALGNDSNTGRNNIKDRHLVGTLDNKSDITLTMLEELVVDFSGAVERGDEDSMDAFLVSHSV
jgi:hypothetical protein